MFSYWLERQGIPVLHASAVTVEGQAVAFLSSNDGGKTSLAATLMQAGYALLTDDLLPVERADEQFLGRPAIPRCACGRRKRSTFLGATSTLSWCIPPWPIAVSLWAPKALAPSATQHDP